MVKSDKTSKHVEREAPFYHICIFEKGKTISVFRILGGKKCCKKTAIDLMRIRNALEILSVTLLKQALTVLTGREKKIQN